MLVLSEVGQKGVRFRNNSKKKKNALHTEGIEKPTIRQRVASMGGFTGLYRGITPGLLSIFMRNGVAMVVMQKAQSKLVEWGLRE